MRRPRHVSLRHRALVHEPDWWLLAVVVALVTFGTVMVYSASFPDSAGDGALGVLARQLVYVAVGAGGLVAATHIDYHRYATIAFPAMAAMLLLLAALIVVPGVGTTVYGAKSWIFVGSVSFQPSEVAKLVMILYMATWLAGKRERVRSFSSGLAQFSIVMGILVGLVMLQPDLGTSILIATIGVAMFLVAGAQLLHFGVLAISGSTAFLMLALSAPYRRERLLVFLNPDADIQNLGWQLYQARLALGSGGLFGTGLGASRQKFDWLPAAHNDAIFAVIGEELGLIGCGFVLLLFVAVAYRGYRVALRAPDAFGALVAVGVTTWLIFQAVYNIGGVTLAIPFTGIPLPFISAGGTALVVGMVAMGVLLNVSRQTLSEAELRPLTHGGNVSRDDCEASPKEQFVAETERPAARIGDWTAPLPVVGDHVALDRPERSGHPHLWRRAGQGATPRRRAARDRRPRKDPWG